MEHLSVINWVDYKMQGNNTRRCRYLTYKGKTQSMMSWSEELGINYYNLRSKIRNGWTLEEVIGGKKCQKQFVDSIAK